MAKYCSRCGKKLSFRNSFVWEKQPICRSCLEYLGKGQKFNSFSEIKGEFSNKEEKMNSEKEAKKNIFLAVTISTIIWGIIILIVIQISLSKAAHPVPFIVMASTFCLFLWAKTNIWLLNLMKK